jgi:hypothetical protein
MKKQETNVQPQVGNLGQGLPGWKRVLDLTLIFLLSPGLLLLGGLAVVLIKLGSPGPCVSSSERCA